MIMVMQMYNPSLTLYGITHLGIIAKFGVNTDNNVCFDDSVNDVWLKFLSPINEAIDTIVPLKIRQKRDAKSRVTKMVSSPYSSCFE